MKVYKLIKLPLSHFADILKVNSITSITILFILFVNSLFSQTDYLVGHIGLKDGLSSQLCSHLVEDDSGNLWISTYQDVQKYDGYSVTIFPLEINEGKKSGGILDLFKDASGNVWVVQGEQLKNTNPLNWSYFYGSCNVRIIDSKTDSIFQLEEYIGAHEFGELKIAKIFKRDESLFIHTLDNRIFRYKESLRLVAILEKGDDVITISGEDEIIYLGTDGLNTLGAKQNPNLVLSLDILDNYDGIIASNDGEIFFIDENIDSLSIHEFKNSKIYFIASVENETFNHRGFWNPKIELYDPNIILVWNKLFEIQANGKLVELKLERTERLIREYLVTKSGLGFAATDLGVYILDINRNRFEKLASNNDIMNSVRAFYSDPNIAFYKEGVEKIVGRSKKYDLKFLDEYSLGYLNYHHYQDPMHEDHIWTAGVSTDEYLIRRIDLANGKVEKIKVDDTNTLAANHILRSSKSKTLYISNDGRPYYFDDEAEILRYLDLDCIGNNNILTNHIIQKNNEIWFASSEGVIQYNELNNTCILKKIFPESDSYVIQFIHEDKNESHIVWLGTRRGGLVKWNTETDNIKILNTENGLSNNDVHAIIEDNIGRLWIPTNKYLNTFDKKSENFYHFTEVDGLPHSEFNKYSFFHDTHEQLVYFGGLNGYIYFNPDSISTSLDNKVELRIKDVKKIDRDAKIENLYTQALSTNSISMHEKDISIQIELATNYLLNISEKKYSYRIPGLLDEWRTETSNIIRLNRLPYGKYNLEFVADMNKFSSMSDVLSIDLDVQVPWWKSTSFILFSILSIICLLYFSVRNYNKRIIDRNTKLEELVSLRTEELKEVIKTKNKIFAILAHDLRNPISGLSNLSNKIKFLLSKNRFNDLNLIAVETEKRVLALNNNLNNIMYWALSENNTLTIQPRKLFLSEELKQVLELYMHEIENKKLKINLDIEKDVCVLFDLTILQTLLRNFIHNSIKFSYEGGKIDFSIVEAAENNITLIIRDFGVGIDTHSSKSVNLENQKIRNQGKGTGLGLKISKELADKAGVKYSMESEQGKGTITRLNLPKFDRSTYS